MKFLDLIPLLLVISTPLAAIAQRFPANYPIHSQIVRFQPGHTTAIIRGIARTPGIYEYHLRARAGQHMTVHLTSSNKGVELTINDPNNTALKNALGVDDWEGTLETSGDYNFRLINNRSRVALNPSLCLGGHYQMTLPLIEHNRTNCWSGARKVHSATCLMD